MPFTERHRAYFSTLHSIKPPRVMIAVAWLLIGGAVVAAAALAFTPWVQTASGTGAVTALNPNDRVQDINALVAGRIAEWHVRDGSVVRGGDPLLRIVDNDPMLIERLSAERTQVEAKLSAAKSALSIAEIDFARTESLFRDGLAARREAELARIKVEEFRAKAAEAAAELNRINVSLSRQSAQIVRAPRDGVILRVNAGDAATFVKSGDVVATFAPAGAERAVELFVDGRDIALIEPGARARLEFEGWPAVQFSGWPSVAVGVFDGIVTAIDPSASANGRFRVLVIEDPKRRKWPDDRFIRYGSSVRGWILLDTVPLGYELWRQLNNFPPEFPAGHGADFSKRSSNA